MKTNPDPLASLLASFRRDGNADAMERLVEATRRKLMAVARRIGSPQDAEDSVQAAYHALLARPEAPDAPILPWLLTTVVRIAYRKKAVAQRSVGIAERLARPECSGTPLQRAANAEEAALIRREVSSLPAKYRNALVLYYLDGLSIVETAKLLEVKASTVTTRLHRGRMLLRSRLGTVLGVVFALPWLLLDCSKAWGAVTVGGIMKVKTAAMVAGVALATGTLGVVVGSTVVADESPTRTAGGDRHHTAELLAKVQDRDVEIERLREQLRETQGATEEAGGAAPDPGQPRSKRNRSTTKPLTFSFPGSTVTFDLQRAQAAAKRLGVSKESLQVAIRAYTTMQNSADPAARVEAKAAFLQLGHERTRVAAAVISGVVVGPMSSSSLGELMGAARVPGQEEVFVDILRDDVTDSRTKHEVVRHIADAEVVRHYLVERLEAEDNKYMFATIGMALGRMKETRAIPALRKGLETGGGWNIFHVYMLFALGSMGGREAEGLLVDYLRSDTRYATLDAVRALGKINRNLAKREVQVILDRNRNKLSKTTVEKLREYAGR